jgi:hypothetical protein
MAEPEFCDRFGYSFRLLRVRFFRATFFNIAEGAGARAGSAENKKRGVRIFEAFA